MEVAPSVILPRAVVKSIGHSEEAPAAVPEKGQDLSQGSDADLQRKG